MRQAINLIARVLIHPGDTMTIEGPGYPPMCAALQALGAKVVLVPIDAESLVVDALPRCAKLVYVTSSHQFPLGMPTSLARQTQLLDWAQHHDALITEDDYDSEFRFDGRPMESLRSLDAAGCVVYVGAFSKTVSPELRIGHVVPPASLVAPLRHTRQVADWHSKSFIRVTLAKFMFDDDFAKYLRHMHKEYAACHDALLRYPCGPLAPQLMFVPSATGIHMAAQVQAPLAGAKLVELAESAGVGLYGTARMFVARPPQPGLLTGYGHVNVAEINAGLDKLVEVLAKMAT